MAGKSPGKIIDEKKNGGISRFPLPGLIEER
jgi:hypothetical protein